MSYEDKFNDIRKRFDESDSEEESSGCLQKEEDENTPNFLKYGNFDFNNIYEVSGEKEQNDENNERNNFESKKEENISNDKEDLKMKYPSSNLEGEEFGNESFRPKPQPSSPEFGTMKQIYKNENDKNLETDEADNDENIKKTDNNNNNIDINYNISSNSSEERREKDFLMREEKKIKQRRENNKIKDSNERKENSIKEEQKKEEIRKEKEKENNQIKYSSNQDDKKINDCQKNINQDINISNKDFNLNGNEEEDEKCKEERFTSSNENSSFIQQIKEMNIKLKKYTDKDLENNNDDIYDNVNDKDNDINNGKIIQNRQNDYIIKKDNKNNSPLKKIYIKNNNNNKFHIKNQKNINLELENGLKNINLLNINCNKMNYNKNNKIYYKKYTNKNYPTKFQNKSKIKRKKTNSKKKEPLNSKRENLEKKCSFTPDKKQKNKLLTKNKSSINDIGLYRKKSSNLNNERMCKKIDSAINEYSFDDGLSIINVVQVLYDLNIIHEIIRNNNQNINLNMKEMKKIVNNIKKKDYKKLEELEFLEQLWFTINPSMNEYINTKFFYEFLKLMLSSEKKFLNGDIIKDLSLNIENLLNQNYNKNDSYKSYNTESFISPLSNKKYEVNELWSVPKLIKIFFKLKSQKINEYGNKKDEMAYLKEDKEKELTFKPNLKDTTDYFQVYSKFNYYNYNQIDINKDNNRNNGDNSGKNKNIFDKVYERFMKEKNLHDKTIEKMREIMLMKENKKCPHVPKINKYYPRSQERMNGASDNYKKIPVYERLYNLRQVNNENNSLKRSKTADFNFGNNISTKGTRNKSPYNYNKKNILKNGELINEEENQSKINMKKPINMNMNSTYLNNNKKMDIGEDIIDNIYITIEIKINNGQLKPLKIYKNQNDTNEMVNNFCEKYNISEEGKKVIFNKVKYYQKIFFKESINN